MWGKMDGIYYPILKFSKVIHITSEDNQSREISINPFDLCPYSTAMFWINYVSFVAFPPHRSYSTEFSYQCFTFPDTGKEIW